MTFDRNWRTRPLMRTGMLEHGRQLEVRLLARLPGAPPQRVHVRRRGRVYKQQWRL